MPRRKPCQKFLDYCSTASQTERLLVTTVFASLLAIIILICLLLHYRQHLVNDCQDLNCIHQSSYLMHQLDQNVNPCDDFYSFICNKSFVEDGHGNKEFNLIAESKRQHIQDIHNLYLEDDKNDHRVVTIAKKFYKACMNLNKIEIDGLKTIKKVLNAVVNDDFDWMKATYQLRQLGYPFSLFLQLNVRLDSKNNSIFEIAAPQTWSLQATEEKEYISSIIKIISEERVYTAQEINETYELFKKMQMPIKPTEMITLKELQKKSEIVNWLDFVRNVVGPKVEVNENTFVLVDTQDLSNRIDCINRTSKTIQQLYTTVFVVEKTIPYLTKKLRNLQQLVFENNFGTRAEFCIKTLDEKFNPSPIDIVYARRFITDEKKTQIELLVETIKKGLLKKIIASDWTSEKYRDNLIGKLNTINILIGPGKYKENEQLDQLDVDMVPNPTLETETFLDLFAQVNRNYETWLYSKINNGTIDRWFVNSTTLGPHYFAEDNLLYIPTINVANIFFDETRPNYLNYGYMGSLISRKLSDVVNYINFDDNLEEIAQQVTKQSTCLKDYGAFDDGMVYETLLDISGLDILNFAYQNWVKDNRKERALIGTPYTPNQLFWISSSPIFCHSVSETVRNDYRYSSAMTNAIIYNTPHLLKVFDCSNLQRKTSSKICKLI